MGFVQVKNWWSILTSFTLPTSSLVFHSLPLVLLLNCIFAAKVCVFLCLPILLQDTPNANMADHSVGARDESHESEASWALMFCFDNVSPEKACFVVNLVCFISLRLRVAVFLNAARKDINLPPFAS